MAQADNLTYKGTEVPKIEFWDQAGAVRRTIILPEPHRRRLIFQFFSSGQAISLDGTSGRNLSGGPSSRLDQIYKRASYYGFRALADLQWDYLSAQELEKIISIFNCDGLKLIFYPHKDFDFKFEVVVDKDFNFQFFHFKPVGYAGTLSLQSVRLLHIKEKKPKCGIKPSSPELTLWAYDEEI